MKIRNSLASFGAAALLILGTFSGLESPAAAAGPDDAVSQSTSQDDGRTDTGSATAAPMAPADNAEQASSSSERGLARCWNGRVSGRDFYMTCSGNGYKVYLDCTNGRYKFNTVFYGTWNHRLTCPVGTSAVWGGSWQ
ncbi:hypothetical protein ACFQ2B_35380 [Streptomyces stramineus]|uniref:Chitin-binding type-2 domain-containing protein n=1 Tax=Streptomyces stramineus TaxID=173861 RepID=A0ABN0ZC95_9ACTN